MEGRMDASLIERLGIWYEMGNAKYNLRYGPL